MLSLDCTYWGGVCDMLVYDSEVFFNDWMIVVVDLDNNKEYNFVNDSDSFREFYESHKNEVWCSFNGRAYDTFILKGILCGHNPYKISQFLIEEGRKGWEYDPMFRNIQLYDFDIYVPFFGLKTLEAFMGDTIKESTVPFTIARKLTKEELEETLHYCRTDVLETIKVLRLRKNEFDAQFSILKDFDLPLSCISKTKAQLTAIVLEATKCDRTDEWDFEKESCVDVNKYTEVLDWFNDSNNRNLNSKLEIEIAGVPHVFGWGGVHGAVEKYNKSGLFLNMDVQSYYPSLMIEHDMLSRNCRTPEKFKGIYKKRLRLKAEGKKAEQAPYKIILNSTYGASNDKYNALYDPRQAHRVCMNGQLMLLDLIEKLEPYCEIVNSNTDGVLVRVENEEMKQKCIEISHEWEKRTKMVLEFDEFVKVIQRDVNNYIIVPEGELYDKKGKPRWKAKGAVVKELSVLDNDLPIVNEAVKMWFLKGIPPEKTVWDCDEMIKFQKIFKVSSLYKDARLGCTFREESVVDDKGKRKKVKVWNGDGEPLNDKTFRVFASTKNSGALYKRKEGKNPEKFASCPDNCFIENESIVGKTVKEYKDLDKQWYVDLARKRILEFV